MSDFFTRLAERILGQMPTIQPIKPSLFASEPDHSDGDLLEIVQESEAGQIYSSVQQPIAAISTQPSDVASMPVQARAVEPPIASPRPTQVEYSPSPIIPAQLSTEITPASMAVKSAHAPDNLPHPVQHGLHHSPEEKLSPASIQIRSIMPLTSEIEPAQPGTHTQSVTTTRIHPAARKSSHPMSAESGMSSGNVSSSSAASDKSDVSVVRVETVEIAQSPALPQSSSGTEGMARPLSAPSLTAHKRPRRIVQGEPARNITHLHPAFSSPPARGQPEAASQEPTIQVTIGRVEVRAVSATTSPTRARQEPERPAAMSLDEYLRRQGQGGRR